MTDKMFSVVKAGIRFLPFGLFAILLLTGCQEQNNDGRCHIYGTVGQADKVEGKRIFLVPLTGPATAETVDSVEVKDGKFEFSPDSMQMYKILLDYHYRLGFETLIIVGEPGNIYVTIDSISHGRGTAQNDSLEKWKDVTEKHNREYAYLNRAAESAKKSGKTQQADSLSAEAKRMHLGYKQFSRRMADNLKEGVLHDFLKEHFPLTYKRKMPDGTVITMDADTNEPIQE
ncbi:MAG: DUF4369 domain-containing protein [Prevotella sp.]|nr:DUF4369 domain-containing protein [Prevotella sp.]